MAVATSGIRWCRHWLSLVLSYSPGHPHQNNPHYADDEFWAAFDVDPDYEPRVPWYRKTAKLFAVLIVAGMIATGALIPWGELLDRLDNVSEPQEILVLAEEVVSESPYGWLVTDVRVRDIPDSTTGGFVVFNPADGIITLDRIGWDPDELRSTTAHEIGHLLDFAGYDDLPSQLRRDGLGSEAWAECAAVDAGFRRTDSSIGDSEYHCTDAELEQYRFSVSLLGEVCKTWGDFECRQVSPIGPE